MICRYFPCTIELQAPALFTAFGDELNSSRTLSFIPGSALRGWVAQCIGDPERQPEHAQLFHRLILDGSVRYLNAYPLAGGRRTLPTPVSFRVDKNALLDSSGAIKVWDLAAFSGEADVANGETAWPLTDLQPLPEGFVSLGGAQPLRIEPRRASRIHQQRDRSRGRAWKDDQGVAHGSLFVYESLEPDQKFQGLLLLRAGTEQECHVLAEQIKACFRPPGLLGRSQRAGYGGNVHIQWHSATTREIEGQDVIAADLDPGAAFRLLTTSSYIGRDAQNGQIDPRTLLEEVENAFSGRVAILRKRWTFETVGGFNRKWRLEIPQALAVAPGSTLVLKALRPIPLSDICAIEHDGLGERKTEGFGRILFLEEPTEEPVVLRRDRLIAEEVSLLGPIPDVVTFAEHRFIKQELSRAIAVESARLARSARNVPTASLLGRLRAPLRAAPELALNILSQWLSPEGPATLRRPALDQLERCRLDGGRSLASWLRELANEQRGDHLVSQILRFPMIAQRYHVATEATAGDALNSYCIWAKARIIDGLLAALARTGRLQKEEVQS
jgi:CRISPR-associated protein Csx10